MLGWCAGFEMSYSHLEILGVFNTLLEVSVWVGFVMLLDVLPHVVTTFVCIWDLGFGLASLATLARFACLLVKAIAIPSSLLLFLFFFRVSFALGFLSV